MIYSAFDLAALLFAVAGFFTVIAVGYLLLRG
jgi:hypothetical protein